MLIIMNPPYGLNNSIAKKIIPQVLPTCKTAVVLVPKNTYKKKECLQHVKEIKIVENVFEDAAVQNLSIAVLEKDWENTSITMESISLSPKQMQLATAVKEYNKTHEKTYNGLKFSGAPIGNKMSKTVEKAALNGICDYLKPIANMTLKDARDARLFFITTVWTPSDGVHISQAHDWTYNLQGKWDPDWDRMCPVNALIFLNKQERDNFKDWWYSCLKGQNGKKQRVGLTNAFLDICRDAISSSGVGYEIYFPNLDWSRPWTDKEILKEIGLPETFSLDEKRLVLAKAIKDYNNSHDRTYENIAYFNTKESKKLSECKTYDSILKDEDCKKIFEEDRSFVYTIRVAGDGVHVDGDDTKVNRLEKAAWINPHKRYFDAFVFSTSVEKQNFMKWWNSCIVNNQKSMKGLTNKILSIICDCVSGGAGVEAYKTYFPHLDWSRPWTDKEILKEIGLPEDFLEDVTC